MDNRMRCGWILVALLLGGVWGMWRGQPVGDQELLANLAKARDFFGHCLAEGGLAWWSSSFLQGTSLAAAWGTMGTNLILWVASLALGDLAGAKAAVVVFWGVGALGQYAFLRVWTGDVRAAWWGVFYYLAGASLLTRAFDYEHVVTVASMGVLPWVFAGVVRLVERPDARNAVLCGMAGAVLFLTYAKTGFMALPAVLALAVASAWRAGAPAGALIRAFATAAGVFFVLAILPNLPAWREAGSFTMFELAPFESWQRAFSSKSAVSWIDRAGVLSRGMDPGFAPTTAVGGTYLGLAGGLIVAFALWRGILQGSLTGWACRVLAGIALGMFWLSHGPRSVVGGHFAFLEMSGGAADWLPAAGWVFLAASVWVIFQLLPSRGRPWIGAVLAAVYLFVPGFRLIEWLPGFSTIRAPFDFFQVSGAVCWAGAVGLATCVALGTWANQRWRRAGAVALVAAVACDVSFLIAPLRPAKLEFAVWNDFLEAQAFLKSAPVEGRVYPFSGRYFYLMTPLLSGRALATEAFNSYLQQKGVALLQSSAFFSPDDFLPFLRISGIAYVLVDKSDPDTGADLQERLRTELPVVFENTHMAVLGVPEPLGGAFLAQDFVRSPGGDAREALAALGAAGNSLAMIESPGGATDEPGLQGVVKEGRIVALEDRIMHPGRDFLPVAANQARRSGEASWGPAPEGGWLVFNDAWHPDWTAWNGRERIPVVRAFGALNAVAVRQGETVVFRFQAPWWYGACVWTALVGWLLALGWVISRMRAGG